MITNTLLFFSLILSLFLSPLSPVPEQAQKRVGLMQIDSLFLEADRAEMYLDTAEARLNRAWEEEGAEKTGYYVDKMNELNAKREEIEALRAELRMMRRAVE